MQINSINISNDDSKLDSAYQGVVAKTPIKPIKSSCFRNGDECIEMKLNSSSKKDNEANTLEMKSINPVKIMFEGNKENNSNYIQMMESLKINNEDERDWNLSTLTSKAQKPKTKGKINKKKNIGINN